MFISITGNTGVEPYVYDVADEDVSERYAFMLGDLIVGSMQTDLTDTPLTVTPSMELDEWTQHTIQRNGHTLWTIRAYREG